MSVEWAAVWSNPGHVGLFADAADPMSVTVALAFWRQNYGEDNSLEVVP